MVVKSKTLRSKNRFKMFLVSSFDFIIADVQVGNLVERIQCKDNLLDDLSQFNEARRDNDGTEIQAFVAECCEQVSVQTQMFPSNHYTEGSS